MSSKNKLFKTFQILTTFIFILPVSAFFLPNNLIPGSLDPTFGAKGKVTTTLGGNSSDVATAVAVQSDGKMVVVGTRSVSSSTKDSVIIRYNTDGTLDGSFDFDGVLVIPVSNTSDDQAEAVEVQSDGKIVVAGSAFNNSTSLTDFYVLRLDSNGLIDSTFGNGGKTFADFNGKNDYLFALVLQGDGKILVGGMGFVGSFSDFGLIRLDNNGLLDSSFGTGGKVVTAITVSDDGIRDLAIQADGKIVAAGFKYAALESDFAVVRYNSDGSMDLSFDGDGIATTPLGGYDSATAVNIQLDGKIVSTGYATFGSYEDFAVVRFNTDGSLDTTFDTDGKVTTAISTNEVDICYDGIVQSDGKILAIGRTRIGNPYQVAIVRFNTDGSLDNTFNNTGILITSVGTIEDSGNGAVVLPNGKFLVVGSSFDGVSERDFMVLRYEANGNLDTTFGSPGRVTTSFRNDSDSARAVTIQPDGKIIAVGSSRGGGLYQDFALARYNANGEIDMRFGGNGKVITSVNPQNDGANKVAVQTDGKIVVAGYTGTSPDSDIALVRYNPNGTLDSTFGNSGKVVLAIGTAADTANDLIIQPDGKIVTAGVAVVNSRVSFAIVRFNVNGSLDTTFDGDGIVITEFTNGNDRARTLEIQPDGKIVVAGDVTAPGTFSAFALIRYNPTGSIDTGFGTGGKVTTSFGNVNAEVTSMALQADGKVVVSGFVPTSFSNDFATVRYNNNGTLDTGFDGDGIVTTTVLSNSTDETTDVQIQKNGKIILSGVAVFAGSQFNIALVRYLPNGMLDTAFGSNGISITDYGNFGESVYGSILQRDGKIVVVGGINSFSKREFAVFRYAGDTVYSSSISNDFDGDGKTDISVFRPSVGEWYFQRSGNGVVNGAQFGSSTDKPAPADYTGDGKTDIAFFRPSTGEWFIIRSEDSSYFAFPFGATGDIPSPGDFDGDGKADQAVFRPSNGVWYINKSSGGVTITSFGTNGDRPVVADYDGDGKSDIAIFRPSVGEWYTLRSSDSQVRGNQFGASTDKPVQGDYTGDGKADFAFFRPSTGSWFVLRSEDSSFFASPFGISTDTPTIGDYDGDGKFDQAVFRPSEGVWYVNRSTAGLQIQAFGATTDSPVPSYYLQ